MKAILHYRCQNENQKRTNETLATSVKRSESKCIQDKITKQGNIVSRAHFKHRATVMPNSIDRIKFDFSTAVVRCLKPSCATAV